MGILRILILFGCGAIFSLSSSADDLPQTSKLEFIQMADTQLGLSDNNLLLEIFGLGWDDNNTETDSRLFEQAIATANKHKPAFVIICGDLINRPGHTKQLADFKRISSTLNKDITLHLVSGNHDLGSKPTAESLRAYRRNVGPDWYSFEEDALFGIVLNSSLIGHPEKAELEAEKQWQWLKQTLTLAKASGKQIMVFQHHPYFLEQPDESTGMFNIAKERREKYLALLKEYDVDAVFAGHYHRNSYGRDGGLQMITTGAVSMSFGDDPSGMRMVSVTKDGFEHRYIALDDDVAE